MIVIEPNLVLVNVHVTSAPGVSTMSTVPAGAVVPSSHTIPDCTHPATAASVTV